MSDFRVMDGRRVDRRHVLGAALFVSGMPGLTFAAEASSAVVETTRGRVRGTVTDGISAYKGIRYGADTSGRNRFLPPRPVAPWTGVLDAVAVGPIAPQFGNGQMSEDCLVLNVWTPGPSRTARRPVLVHLHGGGFYSGSGGSARLDGAALARFGDVVVVTLNHRLSVFGHLHLRDFGAPAEFADSGAAGMVDIVLALRWVQDNIEAFGGDPRRVLVFGQSGGGRKASALMAMPGARGLMHRAGIMSGAIPKIQEPADGAKIADRLLRLLNLRGNQVAELQALPMQTILAAQLVLEQEPRGLGEAPMQFLPVRGGAALPNHPFDPNASPLSRDVPMISSTTLDERSYRLNNFNLDVAGFRAFAAKRGGEALADKAVALYRSEDPGATPYLLQARLDTDTDHRLRSTFILESKVRQGGAPAYSYLWKKPTFANGGRTGALHAIDVGPSMRNPVAEVNGAGPADMALMDQISSQWIAFATTGDPNNPRLPRWAPYDLKDRTTAVYDQVATVEKDPRKSFRELWASHPYPVNAE